jgi:hypothetical protein
MWGLRVVMTAGTVDHHPLDDIAQGAVRVGVKARPLSAYEAVDDS